MCFKIDNYIIRHNKDRKDLTRFSTTWTIWGSRGKESRGQIPNESVELLIRGVHSVCGLKHYFKNGNDCRATLTKYATVLRQVLPAEVPGVTVSGGASLMIPICRGDTHSHPSCNSSRKLQSTFASKDISAVASLSLFFPIHNMCVEVCWKCTLLCYSLACALHYAFHPWCRKCTHHIRSCQGPDSGKSSGKPIVLTLL